MTQFFNAFHAPVGAHSSFTLGCAGKQGGLGLELGTPADENVYIGLEGEDGVYDLLPFYAGAEDESKRYDHSSQRSAEINMINAFRKDQVSREFRLGVDTWKAGDLTFSIYSPIESVPDPAVADDEALKAALKPSVLAELTVDNRASDKKRRAVFGYVPNCNSDANRTIVESDYVGIAKGMATGIFSDSDGVAPACQFGVQNLLREEHPVNYRFGLGGCVALLCDVPAGQKTTFRFAVCFFRPGIVTQGIEASYFYARYFDRIEAVAHYSLEHFDDIRQRAVASDDLIKARHLNEDQRFQMIHAIRSYYGSTQMLDHDGEAIWVVNEGEYRMMNTFDLTVDQLFYELKLNPWTVKNELDLFTRRYSYTDKVHFPGGDNEHPGGISFTHDMGQCNVFSRAHYSAYEMAGRDGCFSYMTHEQLLNWVLCASLYVKHTGDDAWLQTNRSIFEQCLESMLNRDHPVAGDRNGIMGLDSSRTAKGSEITTYDSLDESLGQARNNLYMAVKGWAAYLALADMCEANDNHDLAATAVQQAKKAADSIVSFQTDAGYIPAIMGENSDSKIIPAIEGLVFPYLMGYRQALDESGPYGQLIQALKTHFSVILKEGTCLYPGGAWKLSSTADNSWLSKIYLCQFVARQILGIRSEATGPAADAAHKAWLLADENVYFAWSDQMKGGVAKGSKYYPRGVTSILWCDEKDFRVL